MIILETIIHRWYVFGFIALFFWAASAERDWKRTLRFLAIAGVVEFIAEFTSTHYGFPFGRYEYIAETRGDELYLSNIPLFVPISFGVALWAGRSLAQAGLRARSATRVIVLGAVMAMALDLIIDPMTLRGRSWFLGPLYLYESGGVWFDVPWSNAGGWLLVSALALWVDELFETHRARVIDPVRGPTLAVVIVVFFMLIALLTTHWRIFVGQAVVAAILWALCAANITQAYTEADAPPEPQAPPD